MWGRKSWKRKGSRACEKGRGDGERNVGG